MGVVSTGEFTLIDVNDGMSVATKQIYLQSLTQPTAPTGGSYVFSTDAFTAPTGGWAESLPTTTTTPTWISSYQFYTNDRTLQVTAGTWSVPRIFVVNGAQGSTGPSGSRGSGWYSASGTVWSDTTANDATPGDNVIGDIVTISSASFSDAKKWNGTAWVAPELYLNGSMIVNGTIDTYALKTNNALVGHTLQSSDFSVIGGRGFRLKANALATFNDPTTYGGYVRGGIVYGSRIETSVFKLGAGGYLECADIVGNYCPAIIHSAKVATNPNQGDDIALYIGSVAAPNWGTGYSNIRANSWSPFVVVKAIVTGWGSGSALNLSIKYYNHGVGSWYELSNTAIYNGDPGLFCHYTNFSGNINLPSNSHIDIYAFGSSDGNLPVISGDFAVSNF